MLHTKVTSVFWLPGCLVWYSGDLFFGCLPGMIFRGVEWPTISETCIFSPDALQGTPTTMNGLWSLPKTSTRFKHKWWPLLSFSLSNSRWHQNVKLPNDYCHFDDKLLEKSGDMWNKTQVQPCDQFGVICHGDLWWSNILFRFAEMPLITQLPRLKKDTSLSPITEGRQGGVLFSTREVVHCNITDQMLHKTIPGTPPYFLSL